MGRAETGQSGRRVAVRSLAALSMLAASYAIATAAGRSVSGAPPDQSAGQAQIARAIGTRITFIVTQSTEFAAGSNDQITILFSDRSWAATTVPPTPTFGEDILQEFSFSARDFDGTSNNTLTFTRFVKDQSFLSARYIRVINHGVEGWGGGTISMSVDGQPILDKEPLQPRKGAGKKGLQDWNRGHWADRTYWEKELPRARKY
jgi:hypothetical protein